MQNFLKNTNQTVTYNFALEKLFSTISDSLIVLKSDAEISRHNVGSLTSIIENKDEDDEDTSEESFEDYHDELDTNHNNSSNPEETEFSIMADDCGPVPCDYLFADTSLSDQSVGIKLKLNSARPNISFQVELCW